MSIHGWITPKKNYIPCGAYQHIEIVQQEPELYAAVGETYEREMAHVREIEQDCEEHAEREGCTHAGWHIYESAKDSARSRMWDKLLKNGFLRVGTGRHGQLHVEGVPQAILQLKEHCERFAEEHGTQCVFEPVARKSL